MNLVESYSRVKPAVVAFCAKYSRDPQCGAPGRFPEILGTGFIVDPCGLIITNQHVVDAFADLPKPPGVDAFDAVAAVLWNVSNNIVRLLALDILSATKVSSFKPQDEFLCNEPPDMSVVGVRVKDLPSCEICSDPLRIKEGLSIATAGFPMGTKGLSDRPAGRTKQFSPFLQSGIISAIQPWAMERPVMFTVSVLTQPGASGSPVFDSIDGSVIGVLSKIRLNPELVRVTNMEGEQAINSEGARLVTQVLHPTNLSIVVPVYQIASQLPRLKEEFIRRNGANQKPLTVCFDTYDPIDMRTGKKLADD